MNITAVEIQSTRIPVIRAHRMAIGTTHFQENVIIKMWADGDEFGLGEAPHMVGHSQFGETPQTVRVILKSKLIPAILGLDPFDQEALVAALEKAVPGNLRAKGALIMAAYDLVGRLLDIPTYNLLGGKFRDRIPLSWSLPISNLEVVVEEGILMVERGWRILKIKVGRSDPSDDVDVVRAVRQAVGEEIGIRVDANQAYDVKTALWVLQNIVSYRVEFMEQPVHRSDIEGMAEVTRLSPIPIMADESAKSLDDLAKVVKFKAADSVSIYITGPGGLINSKKMAALAEAFRMRAYVGGALEGIIGASAGLHLAASTPVIDLGCEMSGQYLLQEDLGTERLTMKDGALVVPSGSGFGIQLDEAKLEKYREGEVELIEK